MNRMHGNLRSLARIFALISSLVWLAGCGGDDGGGASADYAGQWQGRTSNGGSIVFTVAGDEVATLRLSDPQGVIWFPQPVEIEGDSFAAAYGTDTATTDEVSLECTFDTPVHGAGSYSMRKGAQILRGTFEATRP